MQNLDTTSLEAFAASLGMGVGTIAVIIGLLAVWTLIWKGMALWHSARSEQQAWFIILLLVNTVGILEIVYLLCFRKK